MKDRLPSVPVVLRLKRMLENDAAVLSFLLNVLEGDEFYGFVQVLQERLPRPVPLDVLADSCRSLLGTELTSERLAELCWRLAGNVRRLANGRPVLPWDGQELEEWVPAQITGWEVKSSRGGKPGAEMELRVLAGRPAGMFATQFWTKNYCYTFAPLLGFSRWQSGKYPFVDVRQMTDLRLAIRVVPGQSRVTFDKLDCPQALLEWNRKIIRRRSRETFQCPRNYPEDHRCYQCHVGRDRCPAAVHGATYEKRDCPGCGHPAWFDPQSDSLLCVDCTTIEKLKRRV